MTAVMRKLNVHNSDPGGDRGPDDDPEAESQLGRSSRWGAVTTAPHLQRLAFGASIMRCAGERVHPLVL